MVPYACSKAILTEEALDPKDLDPIMTIKRRMIYPYAKEKEHPQIPSVPLREQSKPCLDSSLRRRLDMAQPIEPIERPEP